MSRGLLAAVAFTLIPGATAAARTGGQAARPRTLGVAHGPIVGLAQEGRWFAWMQGRGVPLEIGIVALAVAGRRFAVTTFVTLRRAPVGVLIEGRRVVWAENTRRGARIRAVTAP